MTEKFEGVFDLGTYTTDYHQLAFDVLENNTEEPELSGCTAVAKILPDGTPIVGRNMDFYINHSPYFYGRTEIPGLYKTIFNAIDIFKTTTAERARAEGITEELYKVAPYYALDVMNEYGLFIEDNMRSGEKYPDGKEKFYCSGTNPESDIRISVAAVPQYLVQRCKTVVEAVAMARQLNIYSLGKTYPHWSICYVMCDAGGNYGVMELAANEIIWHPKDCDCGCPSHGAAQANFYITPKYYAIEEMHSGEGRMALVMSRYDSIQSMEDMASLMRDLYYGQTLRPFDECKFDQSSENIGLQCMVWSEEEGKPVARKDENGNPIVITNQMVHDPACREMIRETCNALARSYSAMSREEIMDMGQLWETRTSALADCKAKTLTTTYFENPEFTITRGL